MSATTGVAGVAPAREDLDDEAVRELAEFAGYGWLRPPAPGARESDEPVPAGWHE